MTKTEIRSKRMEYQRQIACVLQNILMETLEDDSKLRREIANLRDTLLTMAKYTEYCILSDVE